MRTCHQQVSAALSVAAISVLLSVMPVSAKDGAAGSRAPIEEVVVTAQKRAENVQEVPIAITVLDEEAIEAGRIQNVVDVANRTPNFYVDRVTPEAPSLSIRGIGSVARLGQAGIDPSVVVYVDEVYIGRAGGSVFDLFDIERVEVLRGPQGTLFGRNAVGGAVHVVTRKPSAAPYAKLQATLGNYGTSETKGAINNPITDDLFAKLSFSTRDADGFNRNVYTDRAIEDTNSRNLRGQLKYAPGDVLSAVLTVDHARDEIDGFGKGPINAAGIFSTDVTGFVPAGFRKFQSPVTGFFDRKISGLTGQIDWQTALGTVTSVSAWRDLDFLLDSDTAGASGGPGFSAEPTLDDSVPGFLSRSTADERVKTFTQEIRLGSAREGSTLSWLSRQLHWTVGGYFMREATDRDQQFRRVLNVLGGPISSSNVLFSQQNDTDSYAVFGQLTYALSDAVEATLGGRQTWDRKEMALTVRDLDPQRLTTNSLVPAIEEFSVVNDETFSAFTPKLSVSYFPELGPFRDRKLMLYTSVSEGFKSGGFDGLAGAAAGASTPFLEETARNYEAGFRSRLFGDRVQLNATFFRLDFKNLQLFQRVLTVPGDQASATVIVVNAEEAQITGVEADAVVRPFTAGALSGLTFLANIGIQNSELTDATLKSALPGLDPDGLTAAQGQSLPRAPKLNYFVSIEYAVNAAFGDLIFAVSDRYTGDTYFDLGEPRPGGFQESYHLFDANIRYRPAGAPSWELKLWGRNLGDEEYYVSQQPVSGGVTAVGSVGEPRTYGLTMSWSWSSP